MSPKVPKVLDWGTKFRGEVEAAETSVVSRDTPPAAAKAKRQSGQRGGPLGDEQGMSALEKDIQDANMRSQVMLYLDVKSEIY